MKQFFTIIKSDYLQRVRSYAFLITLCATLAIAYTFVPEPNANYSTIRISDYVGHYNSAWFGYVTAIMTSIFLSLIGFYLVNSSIKTDIKTKIGTITASTKISNFNYLFSKAITNFIVLWTIMFLVFVMSIILFFLYNDGSNFQLFQFIKPFIFHKPNSDAKKKVCQCVIYSSTMHLFSKVLNPSLVSMSLLVAYANENMYLQYY